MCIGVVASFNCASCMVINAYMSVFHKASGSEIDVKDGTMIVGIVRLVLALTVPFFEQKMNPKVSFVVGQSLISLAMLCMAIFYHCLLIYPKANYISFVNWIPLVSIVLGLGIRTLLIIPVLYSLSGELFPTEIRTLSVGITNSFEWGTGATMLKLFPDMKLIMGLHGLCYLCSCLGFFTAIWGYFTITDNRSKSLVEIEEAYDSNKNASSCE